MRRCKNCGCAITQFKRDDLCPGCTAVSGHAYKLFRRRTFRMLYIGIRDAIIIAAIAFVVSYTRFGRYLKWYLYVAAAIMFIGAVAAYVVLTVQCNQRMYKNGYGKDVEECDAIARFFANVKNKCVRL